MAWTPPPNWPPPPTPGWSPPAGWQPDPSWGQPPEGWVFWPEAAVSVDATGAAIGRPQQYAGAGWSTPAALPPPNMARMRAGAAIVIAGGVLAVFGAFGTWIKVSGPLFTSLSSGGMSNGHDGPFVLVLGLLALGFGLARFTSTRMPGWLAWLAIADGALLALVAIADTIDVHNKVHDVHVLDPVITGHVGWGLIVSVIAGFVVIGGAIACIDVRRKPVQPWQPSMPPPPYAN